MVRRGHRHIFHYLIEEGTARINVHPCLRHVIGHPSFVDIESWLQALGICKATLPLPISVLVHLLRVVAKIKHFMAQRVFEQNLFHLG